MTQRPICLPDLPDYAPEFRPRWPGDDGGFSVTQMRFYAMAAVAADRKAYGWEAITEDYPGRDK